MSSAFHWKKLWASTLRRVVFRGLLGIAYNIYEKHVAVWVPFACLPTDDLFLALSEDGLFRRSANSVMLKQVKDAYDRGEVMCDAIIHAWFTEQ
jgi:hypothetical protein